MELRDHRFRQRAARSDSEIRNEIRHIYLRHGGDENRFIPLARAILVALCVVGTVFLIFKTLYSPAVKAAKPPAIGMAKISD